MTSSSRYECPCCGYPTLTEPTASAICVLCDWAYGQGDSETSWEEYSLAEARCNFRTHLTFRRTDDLPSFTLETHPEVVAAKEDAIAALEQWRAEKSPARREVQWVAVESALRQLQSTRQVEDAFSWTDDYDVVVALVGLVEESAEAVVVSQAQKTILNVQAFDAEVSNGGFHQLFANSTADHAREILAALKEIGAVRTARLLEQALATFPGGQVPDSQAEWDSFLKSAAQNILDVLHKLSEEYFTQEEDVYALAAEYCKNRKSEFK